MAQRKQWMRAAAGIKKALSLLFSEYDSCNAWQSKRFAAHKWNTTPCNSVWPVQFILFIIPGTIHLAHHPRDERPGSDRQELLLCFWGSPGDFLFLIGHRWSNWIILGQLFRTTLPGGVLGRLFLFHLITVDVRVTCAVQITLHTADLRDPPKWRRYPFVGQPHRQKFKHLYHHSHVGSASLRTFTRRVVQLLNVRERERER